jgi:hypothetical protein
VHPALKAALTQLVTVEHHGQPNGYGEPSVAIVGPLRGRWETSRTRTYISAGDTVTIEGILFIDGPDLAVGTLTAGDVMVHPDGKRRAIRVIEPLYDLEGVLDHWELTA